MNTKITPAPAYQRPSGKLYLASNQFNLVDGASTIVELDTIGTGFTDGIEDTVNHRITPGQAGFYNVIGQVTFTSVVADKAYDVGLYVNHATWINYNRSYVGGGVHYSVPVAALVKLTATDYLELIAVSRSGGDTVDILASAYDTFLSVQRVR